MKKYEYCYVQWLSNNTQTVIYEDGRIEDIPVAKPIEIEEIGFAREIE